MNQQANSPFILRSSRTVVWSFALLFAGICFPLGLAPFNYWTISLLSLGVWTYWVLLGCKSSMKSAIAGTMLYGTGFWLSGMGWVYNSIHDYGQIPWWISSVMVLAAATGMACFQVIMVLLNSFSAKLLRRLSSLVPRLGELNVALTAWLWASSVVLTEVFRDQYSFFNVAWLNIGYLGTNTPWQGTLASFGHYGTAWILIWLIASIILLANSYRKGQLLNLTTKLQAAMIGLVVFICLILQWVALPSKPQEDSQEPLKIWFGQTAFGADDKWQSSSQVKILQTLMSKRDETADLWILPEAIVGGPMIGNQTNAFTQLSHSYQIPLIAGAIYLDEGVNPAAYNAALYNAPGQPQSTYFKQKLVAFGETFPAWIEPIAQMLNFPFSSLTAGTDPKPFIVTNKEKTKDWLVGTLICYEIGYSSYTRDMALKSDFIAVISEGQWFSSTAQSFQHLQIAQARAIELATPIVFVNNGGPSGLIDSTGQINYLTQSFVFDTASIQIQAKPTTATLFRSFGYTFFWIFVIIVGMLSCFVANYPILLSSTSRAQDTKPNHAD